MNPLKRLAGETAVYGGSTILGRLINYLLIILYTQVFNPSDYGQYSLIFTWVTFFNIIYTYGTETAFFRFSTKHPENATRTFNTVLSALISSSVFFTGIIILFSENISDALGYANPQIIIWVALTLAVDAIAAIPFAKLRLDGKPFAFAGIKVTSILLNVGLNIFFLEICPKAVGGSAYTLFQPLAELVYSPNIGYGYIFLANLIANSLQLPLLWKPFSTFRFGISFSLFKPIFRYAWPLIFVGLAAMINEVIDRVLLEYMLPVNFYPGKTNFEAVGIYSACYKLSIFMTLIVQAYRFAGEPFFFSNAKDKNSKKLFADALKWFVIIGTTVLLGVSMNLDWLADLFLRKSAFQEALMIVPILLTANLFLGIYYSLSVWYKLTDKTHFGTFISVGGALITVSLNILLIPVLGYFGSAWATLACYFCMTVASYIIGQNKFPVPYNIVAISGYIILAVGLTFIGLKIHFGKTYQTYLFREGLIILFLIIIFLFEKNTFKRKIRQNT